MRSLTLKWMVTLLLTSLVGVVLVGLFAYRTTVSEFDRLRMEQSRDAFVEDVTTYYQNNETWDGLAAWLRETEALPGEPSGHPPPQLYALADAGGVIVFGHGPFEIGE